MIDIENDVFTIVAEALRAAHDGITVSGEYAESFAKLPAVTIVEADNRVLMSMRTDNIENAASLMYEVNVYTNNAAGKKTAAKKIMNTVDNAFEGLGFTRMFREQVPNLKDATIYRIVARYEGTVGEGTDENSYLIYQNY